MVSVTQPWVEPGNPERAVLESMPGGAGLVQVSESVHGDVIASQTDPEAERLGALSDSLDTSNVRHDDMARTIWHYGQALQAQHRGASAERDFIDLNAVLFPEGLSIVQASFRDSAAQGAVRDSQLTPERVMLLASVPVHGGGTLLDLVTQWNATAAQLGKLQNDRATPVEAGSERLRFPAVRDRWVRVVKHVLGALALEAPRRPEAQRILERVANIHAAVRRRLRASDAASDEDGEDGEGDEDAPVDGDVPAGGAG
jgi:hypothetical protein